MDKIKELQEIRSVRVEAEHKEREAFKPLLTDSSHITTIYRWFINISCEIPGFPSENTNASRQRFIFIILLLYSPGSLIGDRIPGGIGRSILNAMGINRSGTISENCAAIPFYYHHEKAFKTDVDYLYPEIQARIELYGLR